MIRDRHSRRELEAQREQLRSADLSQFRSRPREEAEERKQQSVNGPVASDHIEGPKARAKGKESKMSAVVTSNAVARLRGVSNSKARTLNPRPASARSSTSPSAAPRPRPRSSSPSSIAAVGKGTFVEPAKITVAEHVRARVEQWAAAYDPPPRRASRPRRPSAIASWSRTRSCRTSAPSRSEAHAARHRGVAHDAAHQRAEGRQGRRQRPDDRPRAPHPGRTRSRTA